MEIRIFINVSDSGISSSCSISKSKPTPSCNGSHGKYKSIKGIDNIDKIVHISQSPIGRTPRSNPATYVGVFDDIREVFAQTKEAKMLGYDKGRFSFNVKGGRCEACWGEGLKKIEMCSVHTNKAFSSSRWILFLRMIFFLIPSILWKKMFI